MKRFKGFTLAELMVALAVIGIIVAVVTPAIVKTRPNKNKMMVKKTYYTVENIVSSLINDEKLYPDKRDFCYLDESDSEHDMCRWGFDDDSEVEYEGEKYQGKEKFIKLFANKLNVKEDDVDFDLQKAIYYTYDGVKWDLSGLMKADDLVWITDSDGVGTFDETSPKSGLGKILIDVNGDEEPNKLCDHIFQVNGPNDCDQYEIQILANGKMRINPDHTRAIDYVTINTSIKDSL